MSEFTNPGDPSVDSLDYEQEISGLKKELEELEKEIEQNNQAPDLEEIILTDPSKLTRDQQSRLDGARALQEALLVRRTEVENRLDELWGLLTAKINSNFEKIKAIQNTDEFKALRAPKYLDLTEDQRSRLKELEDEIDGLMKENDRYMEQRRKLTDTPPSPQTVPGLSDEEEHPVVPPQENDPAGAGDKPEDTKKRAESKPGEEKKPRRAKKEDAKKPQGDTAQGAPEAQPADPELAEKKQKVIDELELQNAKLNAEIEIASNQFPRKFLNFYKRNTTGRIIASTAMAISSSLMPGVGTELSLIRIALSTLGMGNAAEAATTGSRLKSVRHMVGEKGDTGEYDLSKLSLNQLIEVKAKLSEIASAQGLKIDAARMEIEKEEAAEREKERQEKLAANENSLASRFEKMKQKFAALPAWKKAGIIAGGVLTGIAAPWLVGGAAGVAVSGGINLLIGAISASQKNAHKEYFEYSDLMKAVDSALVDKMPADMAPEDYGKRLDKKVGRETYQLSQSRRRNIIYGGAIGAAMGVVGSILMSNRAHAAENSPGHHVDQAAPNVPPRGAIPYTPGQTTPGAPGMPPAGVEGPYSPLPQVPLRPEAALTGTHLWNAGDTAHRAAFIAEIKDAGGASKLSQEILNGYIGKHSGVQLDHDHFVLARDSIAKDLIDKHIFNADGSLAQEYVADPEKLQTALDANTEAGLAATAVSIPWVEAPPVSAQENVYDASHAMPGATPHLEGTPLPESTAAASSGEPSKGWIDWFTNRFNPKNWQTANHPAEHAASSPIEHGYHPPAIDHDTAVAAKSFAEKALPTTQESFNSGQKVDMATLKEWVGYKDWADYKAAGLKNSTQAIFQNNKYMSGDFRPWLMRMIDSGHLKADNARMVYDGHGHWQLKVEVPHDPGFNPGIKGGYLGVPLKSDLGGVPGHSPLPEAKMGAAFEHISRADASQSAQQVPAGGTETHSTLTNDPKYYMRGEDQSPTAAPHPQGDSRYFMREEGQGPAADGAQSPAPESHVDKVVPNSPQPEPTPPVPSGPPNEIPVPESPFYITDYLREHNIPYAELRKIDPDWFKDAETARAATKEGINYGKIILDFGKHLDHDRVDYEKLMNLGKK